MGKTITGASTWEIFFSNPADASPLARAMAENLLSKILSPLLPIAGGSYDLSSGARTAADIARLTAQGYHPSKTSDHLFGLVEPTAGACDVVPAVGAEKFFAAILPHVNRAVGTVQVPGLPLVKVGQIILEKNRTAWVHISNPKKLFWPKAAGVPTLLRSDDNGKTYKRV